MTIDWAALSDALLVAAILGYVLAMGLHTASLVAPVRVVAAVTSGPGLPAVRAIATDPGPRGSRLGTAGSVTTVLATATHLCCVLARVAATERVPWSNMYEFLLTSTLAAMVVWLLLSAGKADRAVSLFVALAAALLLGGAGRVHVRAQAPLMPALQSPWLRVHVAAAALATGLFLVGFVATALYLLRMRHDAHGRSALQAVATNLPAPASLDRLAFRLHAIAFPVWTFAVATGAVWAEAAWGRYWGWDPKETWAFISWVLYAGYLHARSTAGWRGRRAAVIACAAWVTMLVNVFAVNLLAKGLHSYAGF